MTRPSDWYPLAAFDPVSGDPERVRAAGEDYARVARQIAVSSEELRQIAADMGGGSDAVAEVDAKATRLADTIERAHGRYAVTGDALQTYARALAHAQELSLAAHTAATTALWAQDEALASIARWARLADAASDPVVETRYRALADAARDDLSAADAQLDRARVDLQGAVVQRDGAVGAACAAIRGAMAADDLHDTIWQDLGGGAQEVGLAVWNGVDEVSTALGYAAVLLCWVPGVNGVLASAATIAAALTLARDAVNLATGNGSGQQVGASALGVATFGVGRFAAKGIELSVATARGGRALQHSGLVDEAVGAAAAASRSGGRGASADLVLGATPRRVDTFEVLRSAELWGHMKPSVVARDTWQDLRGGVDLVRVPGPYRPSAAGHVSRPVDAVANPLREYGGEVSTTWAQSKVAGVFSAVGNEAAARGLTAGTRDAAVRRWVAFGGGVQVVETSCALSPAAPGLQVLTDACSLTVPIPAEPGAQR